MTVTNASDSPPAFGFTPSGSPTLMTRPDIGLVTSVFSIDASIASISFSLRAMLYSASRMSASRALISSV